MAQRQFRSDDTDRWNYGFGSGSDGDYSSAGNATDAPIDSSCSGTSGATSLTATNSSFAAGQLILIHQTRGTGAGGWELNKIQSYTAGTITLSHALTMTYTDSGASQAQVIVLKQYNNFTQNSGHTLTAKAWDGNVGGIIAFIAKGDVTITGTLNLSGKGYLGGTTYTTSGDNYKTRQQGESLTGAGANSNSANGQGGGGGGGDYSPGAGAGGGHATAGSNGGGSIAGTAGSATGGSASLVTMVPGGGGGGGGWWDGTIDRSAYGHGGDGGGIVLIICKNLTVSGSINVKGENGNPGFNSTTGDSRVGWAGGGGGAGGSCLFKCQTATLGTTLVTGAASSGGTGYGFSGNGGGGGTGRIHIDYSSSYTGTTSPTIDATNDTSIVDVASSNFFLFM